MFLGIYRYVLAHMVIVSHLWRDQNEWAGAYAVFGFYMLSGFLMSFVINEVYGQSCKGKANFLINRALRIYPPYLLVAAISLTLVEKFPIAANVNSALVTPSTLCEWMHNIVIFGLNGERVRLVPVAWSLDVELTYYVLMTLFLVRNRKTVYLWLAASIIYTLYMIWAGYEWRDRYFSSAAASLPFSIGAAIYMVKERIGSVRSWHSIMAAGFFVVNVSYADMLWGNPRLTGFYVSIALSAYLTASLIGMSKTEVPPSIKSIDAYLGNLAYPIFLAHWPIAVLVVALFFEAELPAGPGLFIIGVVVTNITALLIHGAVETRVNAIRDKVRGLTN